MISKQMLSGTYRNGLSAGGGGSSFRGSNGSSCNAAKVVDKQQLSSVGSNSKPSVKSKTNQRRSSTGSIGSSGSSVKDGRRIGRWFHQKETNHNTMKKKNIARIENAHMHTALSVAGLASALASFAAAENRNEPKNTKMSTALGSATELLASHCIELAEAAGADHDRIASVIRSAMGGANASNLVTLTAAAATALRGEAALKARLPKEAKRNAAITPCEKGLVDTVSFPEFDHNHNEMQEMEDPPCVGDLLHYTRKGVFQWKQVSVYINKKSQVIIKIKGKKAGAFTKKKKYVVYDVCDETGMKQFKKEGENQELYFGVNTAQGVLEFKCKNKVHKQKWINEIQELLLRKSSCFEDARQSMRILSTNRSI